LRLHLKHTHRTSSAFIGGQAGLKLLNPPAQFMKMVRANGLRYLRWGRDGEAVQPGK